MAAALVVIINSNLKSEENFIAMIRLIQSQLNIVTNHLEIPGLPEIQSEFQDFLSRIESSHETFEAQIQAIRDGLANL